jgi:hypothetical protein
MRCVRKRLRAKPKMFSSRKNNVQGLNPNPGQTTKTKTKARGGFGRREPIARGAHMRLARFFHRARDNDARKILLITRSACAEPDRPIVMGLTLTDPSTEFLRRDYPRIDDAISAFNAASARLLGEGYREAAETDYTVSKLPAEPVPKPEWQRILDKLLLALFLEDGPEQSRRIAALARSEATTEPLYRWAEAHRAAW